MQLFLVGAKASFAPISYFSDVEVDIILPLCKPWNYLQLDLSDFGAEAI
jgi:hypothetical protein